MKEKGEESLDENVTLPSPLWPMDTDVALPPKVLSLRVNDEVPHVLPAVPSKLSVGPFTQSHEISKLLPVVVQPEELRTVSV